MERQQWKGERALSLTKLQSRSLEPTSQLRLNHGLQCLSLQCPVLARIPLSQFRENPLISLSPNSPSFTILGLISDHPGLPTARILLGQFSKNFSPLFVTTLGSFPPTDLYMPQTSSLTINPHLFSLYLELVLFSLPYCSSLDTTCRKSLE